MKQKRPNILLITSDQQHYSTLGVYDRQIKTPNLDKLASEGVIFDRAYCPNPTCTPTRASLITGQYPSQHGAYSLGTKLMENKHTVGVDFTRAGYKTALIGKAHFQQLKGTDKFPSIESYPIMQNLDFWRKFTGPFYGFQHIELARNHTDEAHVGQHYAIWMEEKGFKSWREHFAPPTGTASNQKHTWHIPEEYHYDAWIAERTNALLDGYAENDENFFLWASFFDPHPSYLVPEPWDKMYNPDELIVPSIVEDEHKLNPPHFRMTQQEKPDFSDYQEPGGNSMHGFHSHLHDKKELAKDMAIYYGMISLMDKYIGKILDKLDSLGLAEDTIVIFTTDHGHFIGQHGLIAKGPFHYEDMIRVPFIARYPGMIPAGRHSQAMQSLVDLPPTILSFANIEVPESMTGLDQSPVWLGKQRRVRDHIIVENRHQPTTIHVKTYVDKRYKITVYYNHDYGELFDLQEDPGEINNLWDDPDSRELKTALLQKLIWAEMGKEPLLMPRVAGA